MQPGCVKMKQIPLTQGKLTLVDDQDYDFLMQWKWHIQKSHKTIYAIRTDNFNHTTIRMHRIIAKRMRLEGHIDHKDQNGLNNQRDNLRFATNSQQGANQKKHNNNTSGYKGVYWRKDNHKWRVEINVNGKRINLGCFENSKDAARAYNEAAIKYHGEFAVLNEVIL